MLLTKTKISQMLFLSIATLFSVAVMLSFLPARPAGAVTLYGGTCRAVDGHFELVNPYENNGKTYNCARDIQEGDGFAADPAGNCIFGLPSVDTGIFGRICFHGDKIEYGNSGDPDDNSDLIANKTDDCQDKNINENNCAIIGYFTMAINVLSGLVGVVVVAMIVYGGIQYSSAGDDPQKVSAAKKKITNALIALVLYLFMFGLLQWLVPGGVL